MLLVSIYRIQLKLGWFKFNLPISKPISGEFFSGSLEFKKNLDPPKDALLLIKMKMRYFSNELININNPPNWFIHPELNNVFPKESHWSEIDDFSRGDIKLVWEASRFHWLVLASQGFASTKDPKYLRLMNQWLIDWSKNNPSNKGVNWKCGQEASIRIMNLILSSFITGEVDSPNKELIKMVVEHCRRIRKTLHYAIAQDNNHGTSEVSALFIGGSWLKHIGYSSDESNNWLKKGRKGLEERVSHLVMDDGTFSQYSTNYHRLFLDSMSLVEFFRVKFDQPKFSLKFQSKVILAIDWLWQLVDFKTGIAPNLGANDGSLLIQLSEGSYQDFRHSVQLSSFIFKRQLPYKDLNNKVLIWLNIDPSVTPHYEISPQSKLFEMGGFLSIVGEECKGLLCYPNFQFRPSQANLLHFDLIDRGLNILGDGGTYSYNKGDNWLNYFSGIGAHNTIQFNDSEPMKRISRFLYGNWPSGKLKSFLSGEFYGSGSAQYSDYLGNRHERKVFVENRVWQITDNISGFSGYAVLRWRLCKAKWHILENQLVSEKAIIEIETETESLEAIKLNKGYHSDFYNQVLDIEVLEIIVNKSCTIHTTIKLPIEAD